MSPQAGPTTAVDTDIVHGRKLVAIFAALMLAVSLIALDQTILATALPRIASDLQAFEQQVSLCRSLCSSEDI